MNCDVSAAQFVELDGEYYRDTWLAGIEEGLVYITDALIRRIAKEEYEALYEAIENQQYIFEPETSEGQGQSDIVEQEFEQDESDETLEYLKQLKITEVTLANRRAIESGFDYNGNHYTMTTEDLIDFIAMASEGSEEGRMVIAKANEYKMACKEYLENLVEHIESLDSIEDIRAVTY